MNKFLASVVAVLVVGVAAYFFVGLRSDDEALPMNYREATFTIDEIPVALKNNVAEIKTGDGASKTTVRYFGNELKTDLNGDSIPDMVFLVTAETGGSGTFFYAVAALQREDGTYVGSDGYFLGDRIAPQSTDVSPNPRHQYVIVVNYADRKPGEPMATQPSVGKSVYLKIDSTGTRWGIVEPNFEGEER